jgi:hypothetical protein
VASTVTTRPASPASTAEGLRSTRTAGVLALTLAIVWQVVATSSALPSTGGMRRLGKVVVNASASHLYCAVYDPAGFVLVATSGAVNPGVIVKLDVRGDTPVEVGSAACPVGESGLIAGAIDSAAGYAYFGTLSSPGKLIKVALGAAGAPPTYLGSTPLAAGENGVFGLVIDTSSADPANHFLYVATVTNPGIVVKLAPGAGDVLPTRLGATTLAPGEDRPRRGVIDPGAGYAYFATIGDPAVIVKVALGAGSAPPARVSALTLQPGEGLIGSAVIDTKAGYAYFGTYHPSQVPARIVQVAIGAGAAPPTRVGALALGPGERELSTGVGDPTAGFAYFGSDHTHPAKVYKVRLGDGDALPTEVGVLQLEPGSCGTACYPPDGGNITQADAWLYGEIYLQSSVIDPEAGFACFGTDTVPGQLVKVALATAAPQALAVDAAGNAILEPGEPVSVAPSWHNMLTSALTVDGQAANLAGPAGAVYTIVAPAASYGTIAPGSTGACSPLSSCYQLQVGVAGARPAIHWDASFDETLSSGDTTAWKIHVGSSFADVPPSYLLYGFVETLLHRGITLGCGDGTTYCPAAGVTRAQMALFITRSLLGADTGAPTAGTAGGSPYDCGSGPSLFTDVPVGSAVCREVHFIASRGVTLGCASGLYCPGATVSRAQMAIFIARAMAGGESSVPLAANVVSTGRSYDCGAAAILHFSDITTALGFCKHVHYLWSHAVVDGCTASPPAYCPEPSVSRGQMAKFLCNAFAFTLYGR